VWGSIREKMEEEEINEAEEAAADLKRKYGD